MQALDIYPDDLYYEDYDDWQKFNNINPATIEISRLQEALANLTAGMFWAGTSSTLRRHYMIVQYDDRN